MKDYWAIKLPYRCHYSIYLEDGTYCGETFYDVDINTGVASLDIKLSPAARGKGIAFKTIILRDYNERDIEDYIRWMTTEIEWLNWDAPWEAEEDLKDFNPDEFREKKMEKLKKAYSDKISRSSLQEMV